MSRLYSWSRFALRTASAVFERPAPPSKLVFVVTKRCHSRCVYCDIWKVKDTPGALDRELSLDEIRRFARANPFLHWIDFTGGEPTDRPDFVPVVQAFAAACPDLLLVHFPTNGLATRRIAGMVGELRASVRARLVVTVSVDGPPELNDRLRGIRHDFAHAIDTYVAVRRLIGEENVFVGMTLHGHRASTGRTATELVADTFAAVNAALAERREAPLDWSGLHLNIPHLSQHYYGNTPPAPSSPAVSAPPAPAAAAAAPSPSLPPSVSPSSPSPSSPSPSTASFGGPEHRAEIAAALRFAARQPKHGGSLAMRAIERIYRSEALRYLAEGRTGIGCSALLSTAYLSELGEVYPCTIWDKPLGNIRDHAYALAPILDAARRAGIRKAITEARCPNCWTPCEAYPAIAASPARALAALARG